MKIFKNNEELKELIKDGWIIINDDIQCDFDIDVEASINANNIKAYDINAWNINAYDIKAKNISYYAFCVTYNSIECESIKGRRKNSFHRCLDGELIIKPSKKVSDKCLQLQKENERLREGIEVYKTAIEDIENNFEAYAVGQILDKLSEQLLKNKEQ